LETVLVEVDDNLDLPRRAPSLLLMPYKLVTTPALEPRAPVAANYRAAI
jgi:hypothetical protein